MCKDAHYKAQEGTQMMEGIGYAFLNQQAVKHVVHKVA